MQAEYNIELVFIMPLYTSGLSSLATSDVSCVGCSQGEEKTARNRQFLSAQSSRCNIDGSSKESDVSYELLPLALKILNEVKQKFRSHAEFLYETYGAPISKEVRHTGFSYSSMIRRKIEFYSLFLLYTQEADQVLRNYLRESKIKGKLQVKWDSQMNVAGRVYVSRKSRAPETPKFTLQVYDPYATGKIPQVSSSFLENNSMESADTSVECAPVGSKLSKKSNEDSSNTILRKQGIHCFAAHEIGTHLVRSLNEGFQPWSSNRAQFSLSQYHGRQAIETEEGLASLNTAVPARHKYLYSPALLYYAICVASKKTHAQLVDDLQEFLPNYEARVKMANRVKPNGKTVSKGQAYFEGAVRILHVIFNEHFLNDSPCHCQHTCHKWSASKGISDIHMLFAGRVSIEELACRRINRVARSETLAIPHFAKDVHAYKQMLLEIGKINHILTGNLGRVQTSCCPSRSLSRSNPILRSRNCNFDYQAYNGQDPMDERRNIKTSKAKSRTPKILKRGTSDIPGRATSTWSNTRNKADEYLRRFHDRQAQGRFDLGSLKVPSTVCSIDVGTGVTPALGSSAANPKSSNFNLPWIQSDRLKPKSLETSNIALTPSQRVRPSHAARMPNKRFKVANSTNSMGETTGGVFASGRLNGKVRKSPGTLLPELR